MSKRSRMDEDSAFGGFLLGMMIGGVIALFRFPRLRKANLDEAQERLRKAGKEAGSQLEKMVPRDPISENIAEGKEAAQRRRRELGLSK